MSLPQSEIDAFKGLLTQINASLLTLIEKIEYQSKLFEETYFNRNEAGTIMARQIEKSMNILRQGILNNPNIAVSPELKESLETALGSFEPGGTVK